MENLYSNIGSKLKSLAKFFGMLSLICAAIGITITLFGLIIMLIIDVDVGKEVGLALLASIIFGGVGLISTWPLYAFGQLVSDVHILAQVEAEASAKDEVPEI